MLPSVPCSVAEVTTAWLTQVLGTGFPDIAVRQVDVVEVLHGTATKVRIRVDHNLGSRLPAELCLKAGLEEHSDMMAATGIYANEALFFRDITDVVGAPAPRWWWADADTGTGRGAVVMEDLARPRIRFCRSTEPLTVDETEAALAALARFHAARFGRDIPQEWPWLRLSVTEPSPSAAYFRTLGPEVIAAELAKPQRGAVVPVELHDPSRIVAGFWAWVATNHEGPHCLLHGDAHIGNIYVDAVGPRFCDWQTIRYGRPTFDVAYLVGSTLTVEDRRAAERDLLKAYRERLEAAGCKAPDEDQLWFDYRRDMTYGFFAWLTNLDVFQPEEINVATIGRFATAVLDLQSEAAVAGTH
jgi:hypothetical protein